jgi:hypothetical protein
MFHQQIVGLSVFAGGLFLRFGDSAGDRIVDGKASHIERSLNSSGFGLVELDVNWSSVLFETALILTFCGLGIIIVTVLGCCGACYVIKCMIISVSSISRFKLYLQETFIQVFLMDRK